MKNINKSYNGRPQLQKELIDFDIIKGSAYFNTKPSKHNKRLIRQGVLRVLFLPFYKKEWQHKKWYWEMTCLLYLLHSIAILLSIYYSSPLSTINDVEVYIPLLLVFIIALGYGRTSSLLTIIDPIYGELSSPSRSSKKEMNSGLDTALLESDSSQESTDNNEDNSDSTSSSSSESSSSSSSEISESSISSSIEDTTMNIISNLEDIEKNKIITLNTTTISTITTTPTSSNNNNNNNNASNNKSNNNSNKITSNSRPFLTLKQFGNTIPTKSVMYQKEINNVKKRLHIGRIHRKNSNTEMDKKIEINNTQMTRKLKTKTKMKTKTKKKIKEQTWIVSDHSFGDLFTKRLVRVCIHNENGIPQKKSMSIAELRATILTKVKATPPRTIYRNFARISSFLVAAVPFIFRHISKYSLDKDKCPASSISFSTYIYHPFDTFILTWKLLSYSTIIKLIKMIFSVTGFISISSAISTFYLGNILFSALADAEITYHRRLLYAKCFTALTSARRARESRLPHFRLKNVVNIKAWLSLRGGRSWLKRQSRQRVADEIVSSSFLIVLMLLLIMGFQVISEQSGVRLFQSLLHAEVCVWCLLSSTFLLRFMMLGSNINRKYQNTSMLLTEQMNLYLRLLTAPHKKEKLLISNNVLKLASKLLKELNCPNKISGLTMNPLLYNITRVVLLSAFSAAISEFLGFKLKIWKLKV